MPIYEYTCLKCKTHVEILQKMTDKPLAKCQKCGGRLEKEWSRTGIQFKGTGWYVTDYADKKTDAKAEGAPAEAKSETKSEAKGETKSEGRAETTAGAKSESKSEKGEASKGETSKRESAPSGGGKKTPKAGAASKGAGKE
jgi:putative FmdB family regulatory protein